MKLALFAALLVCCVAVAMANHYRKHMNDQVCEGHKFDTCLACCKEHGFTEELGPFYKNPLDHYTCLCVRDEAPPAERQALVGRLDREELYGKDYYKKEVLP